MINAKQEATRILSELPDDCSFEEIQYRLYVAETIESRLQQAERGIILSQNEAEKRLEAWRTK